MSLICETEFYILSNLPIFRFQLSIFLISC
jgi:hypothetical protein